MREGEWVREGQPPHVIVLAGPNGAGKSTTAPVLLRNVLGITESPGDRPSVECER